MAALQGRLCSGFSSRVSAVKRSPVCLPREAATRRVHTMCSATTAAPQTPPATSTSSTSGSMEDAPSCSPSFVSVDNKSNPRLTKVTLASVDYPGLLRSICWVLNGMGVRVQHATVAPGAEPGLVKDEFWITSVNGKKLSDDAAVMLQERLQDFVQFCEPKGEAPEEWENGFVRVSNTEHPKWTVLTIAGEPKNKQGFMLDVVSVVSACGCLIQEGCIQGEPALKPDAPESAGLPPPCAPGDYDFSRGRYFQFLLSARDGKKLDTTRVSSLLFTLSAFMGAGYMPLTFPTADSFRLPSLSPPPEH